MLHFIIIIICVATPKYNNVREKKIFRWSTESSGYERVNCVGKLILRPNFLTCCSVENAHIISPFLLKQYNGISRGNGIRALYLE